MNVSVKTQGRVNMGLAIRRAMLVYGAKNNCDHDSAYGGQVMPQKMLAEKLGVTRAYASYIRINGVNKLNSIEELADVFELDLISFLKLGMDDKGRCK